MVDCLAFYPEKKMFFSLSFFLLQIFSNHLIQFYTPLEPNFDFTGGYWHKLIISGLNYVLATCVIEQILLYMSSTDSLSSLIGELVPS